MIGDAIGRISPGNVRLSVSDSSSTQTPPSICTYRQYELSRQRNPRSSPGRRSRSPRVPAFSSSAIFVATLRLVARTGERRQNVISCSVL